MGFAGVITVLIGVLTPFAPLKTNMTLENLHFFNRKYTFEWWMFPASHVSFFGGKSLINTGLYYSVLASSKCN